MTQTLFPLIAGVSIAVALLAGTPLATAGSSGPCADAPPLPPGRTIAPILGETRYAFNGPEPVVRVRHLAGQIEAGLEFNNDDGACQDRCLKAPLPTMSVLTCPGPGFLVISGAGLVMIEPGF